MSETLDEMMARDAKAIADAGAMTEQQMRDSKAPWPREPEELSAYIESLVKRPHDYGTCVYAMSLAAEAAFNYVAGTLGVTVFQASCADLDFLKRTRGLKGPFGIIDAGEMLYPQYDLRAKLEEWLVKWRPWAAEQAEKKLAESENAHPAVIAHWRELASSVAATEGGHDGE